MAQIGRLISEQEIEERDWEWDVIDSLFNDNFPYGKYYINLNIARDDQGSVAGHFFSHVVFDGTNVEEMAVDADPLALIDELPWRFHGRARADVEAFMNNEYLKLTR